MTNTQVSSARKFATAAFAGVVALSLMLPAQLAFADYRVGTDDYSGAVDNNGDGSVSGTWDYEAEGQEMTLVDYVGKGIYAYDQDLNVQLVGDNAVEGGIWVADGDLTVNGSSSLYGLDKPSITINGEGDYTMGWIGAGDSTDSGKGNVTITDANVYFDTSFGYIESSGGDLTIQDSAVWRTDQNETLWIDAYGDNSPEMLLKGSEINATGVYSSGTMTIDNTNLTVLPTKYYEEAVNSGEDKDWIKTACYAVKGITLIGEENGEIIQYTDKYGYTWYYLYTGDDTKIELRATNTPAYWGTKGMPATGDTTMPLVIGLGITAALAAAATAYSARRRNEI